MDNRRKPTGEQLKWFIRTPTGELIPYKLSEIQELILAEKAKSEQKHVREADGVRITPAREDIPPGS
jgi:hypothetical protein